MSGKPRSLARRYAKAVLEVVSAQGPDAPGALAGELAAIASLLDGNPELRRVVESPAVGVDARRRVLASLAAEARMSPLAGKLLDLLARHDQLELVPGLAEEYREALNQREGRVSAEAVTAVPLAEPQRTALAQALCQAVGKNVELKARVDTAVLGGVRVTVGGRTYDGTVRARLAALRGRLASGS